MFITINRLRQRLQERAYWHGDILVREVPADWTEEDFKRYWSTMSPRERDRHTLYQTHNLLTTNGRTQILSYCSATGTVTPFCQYFALGNFPITAVAPLDAAVQGEVYRAAPTVVSSSGNTTDISMFLNGTTANTTLTNCGIFGNNATGTSGSGTLMTHALFNFTKSSGQQITCDYLITLN